MIYLLLLFSLGICVTVSTLKQSTLEKYNRVQYIVYTKENENQTDDIRDAKFNKSATTVFIIHGCSTTSLQNVLSLKDDLFEHEPEVDTVILVSWLKYSSFSAPSKDKNSLNYFKVASQHIPALALDICEKLIYIHNKGAGKTELIGHGVGAHVAGQAGRLLKGKIKKEVHRIVGLDPARPYFGKHPKKALRSSDAKNVLVFHTNSGRYGYKNEIGTQDIFVNGGKKQPECKYKLTEDFCSHNQAWQAYSNYLKNQTTDGLQCSRYVLCLDVSESMDTNDRFTRVIESAKYIISSMAIGSKIGITEFSEDAHMLHDIVEINGTAERDSLASTLPQNTKTSTAIGAGLRLSMNMLQALPESEKCCPTIFLITDGEQNGGETPEEVLPDLQKFCNKVNCIALGSGASDELEKISALTNGRVFYVAENGSSQQHIDTARGFSYLYENELDADRKPIYLQTRQVSLSNNESTIPIIIDDGIGKKTEFNFVSDEIENVDVNLMSPGGNQYTSASPEYTYNPSSMQKLYKIDSAEPGQWNLTATKATRRTQSIESVPSIGALVTIKTNPSNKKVSPIRLDAIVSNQTLEYPRSINILAELRVGKFPVINAEVIAHIESMNDDTILLHLRDDGVCPDKLANDGVYMAKVSELPVSGRYSVFVTAFSNGTAKLVPHKIDYFKKESLIVYCNACKTLSYFEREANAGSIKLLDNDNEEPIEPNSVTDLQAFVSDEEQKEIALEWTSPVDSIFDMELKQYDVRVLIGGSDFENGFQFNETHVVKGSFDATTGTKRNLVLRIPDDIFRIARKLEKRNSERGHFLELNFALKTIDNNCVVSNISNVVSVSMQEKPTERIVDEIENEFEEEFVDEVVNEVVNEVVDEVRGEVGDQNVDEVENAVEFEVEDADEDEVEEKVEHKVNDKVNHEVEVRTEIFIKHSKVLYKRHHATEL